MMRPSTLSCIAIAALISCAGATSAMGVEDMQEIGQSRNGSPITAQVTGDPDADIRIVVLGEMHGDESAGRRVVTALRSLTPPEGTAIWLVPSMNPDGHARGTRTNARGVDLNRNFPATWREQGATTRQWSGPRAASEPETRAMMRFLSSIRPTAVLSFHQPFGVVDITHAPARAAGKRLAQWIGLPARPVGCSGPCRGTLTEWVTEDLDAIALTVELPASVGSKEVERAAAATHRLARWLSDGKPAA